MSADFFSFALPLAAADASVLLMQLEGAEVEYNGNVYCDVGFDVFAGHVTPDTPLSMCPNFPAFVALDRFTAGPDGIVLLEGHAHRWIPVPDVPAFRAAVASLAISSRLGRAQAMVERGTNGVRDIEAGLAALRQAGERAALAGQGVLLACIPM